MAEMEVGSSGQQEKEEEGSSTSSSSTSSMSYYAILGVSSESSFQEIKRAYRRLAVASSKLVLDSRDRWTRSPSLLSKAKRKFQQIQEAYSVLSDDKKRTLYDTGLYDDSQAEGQGFSDFLHEMLALMAQEKSKVFLSCLKLPPLFDTYSERTRQTMLNEMAQGFETPLSYRGSCNADELEGSRRQQFDSSSMMDRGGSHFGSSSWETCETNRSFCI